MKPGQTIGVREKSRNLSIIKESVEVNNFVPEYLTFDAEKLEGTFTRLPERSELAPEINEALIVEFYSLIVLNPAAYAVGVFLSSVSSFASCWPTLSCAC